MRMEVVGKGCEKSPIYQYEKDRASRIVCGKARVRKKFVGRESQSPGVGLTRESKRYVLWG